MVTTLLGDLIKVKSGDGIAISHLHEYDKYPVYGGNGINGYTTANNVETGTMIIGRVGEKCGNVNITAAKSWVSDNALIVTPKAKYDIEYLKYLLEHTNLNSHANRNAQPVISGQIIYKIEVPYITDTKEQTLVGQMIHQFDTHIANLTELIDKKKAIRDGALEDLVSGRTRLDGFEKIKSQNVRIGSLLKVNRGKRLVRSQLSNRSTNDEKIPVYQNSLIPLGYYGNFNCRSQSAFVIAAGNAGDIGFCTTSFWAADDCYYFEQNDEIYQKYLYYALLNKQQYIYTQTRRTSIPRLSRDILENIIILLPSIAEQESIATVLTAMDREIASLEKEKDKILQIKAGAMDDLLTGRIRLTRQGG